MNNKIIPLIILILFVVGYSFISLTDADYNSEYDAKKSGKEYLARNSTSIKQEKIETAKVISDIIPNYPMQWNEIMNYVSIEITAKNEDKIITRTSTSYTLNTEQKAILNSADLGSDIEIKIKFMYKDPSNDNIGSNRKIKEMEFLVTALPNQEAEYPGGNKKITEYFTKNVINKISENGIIDNKNPATVTYTINEDGKAMDAKLSKTSCNTLLNKLLLEAVTKMPNWKPAKNYKGAKVKEEFKISIPFYFNNGC